MDLIKLNDYTPPSPSTYDIEFSDVNGEESQLEDGTTYIERVRSDVPNIKVGWTNIDKNVVKAITNQTSNDTVTVRYFAGDSVREGAIMRVSSRSLKLKHIETETSGMSYWDLSFELKG